MFPVFSESRYWHVRHLGVHSSSLRSSFFLLILTNYNTWRCQSVTFLTNRCSVANPRDHSTPPFSTSPSTPDGSHYVFSTNRIGNTASNNSSVFAWLFFRVWTCFRCHCLATHLLSGSNIPPFMCHVTIWNWSLSKAMWVCVLDLDGVQSRIVKW
jgi:hypothetical protein